MGDLDNLLASREMILVAGSGGVGKTTIAAALGIAAAERHKGRVLVLTVDPARRLASALGLDEFGNTPTRIDPAAFGDAGVKVRGEMWVAMLDTKAGWDELIRRQAPYPEIRDAVLANPLYENITSRFVHSHEYLAMEQLHDLHARGDFDLVIVDTPPSRSALSILDAPSRMVEFFGSRLLRWLTVPYRSRLFTVASKPFYQVADRVLGSRFLQDKHHVHRSRPFSFQPAAHGHAGVKPRAIIVNAEKRRPNHGNVDGNHRDIRLLELIHDLAADVVVDLVLDRQVHVTLDQFIGHA